MLAELVVTNLGVIERTELRLGPGMTALTGETGAGKTLVVQAIDLLLGGRADPALVGPDGDEARVDGRFVVGTEEIVLSRVVPRGGRSRAYVDGVPATAQRLSELGRELVDLHGQHAHQSLLAGPAQRAALDAFGAVDLGPLRAIDAELRELRVRLEALGGDARVRARELDLVRHQLGELERAAIDDPAEDDELARREADLADATAHREHGAAAFEGLAGEGGVVDALGSVAALLQGRGPFEGLAVRLAGALAELDDVASEIRSVTETLVDDPEALDAVRSRRQLLRDLRRKYGETLEEVLEFAAGARERLEELESHDERAAELDARARELGRDRAEVARAVADARRAAAPGLAEAVGARFAELALPRARLEVVVEGDDPGDQVAFLFEANDAPPARPLAKVASGGELARIMLALRLVLTAGPPTLVFDEVDAGIGGSAAIAVGAALAGVAADHQVLVVTHLAQVAAHADDHVVVDKGERGHGVRSQARRVADDERLAELARMLSGGDGGEAATAHAAELLDSARRRREVAA